MARPRTNQALTVYGANVVLELLRSDEPIRQLLCGVGPQREAIVAAARRRGVPVREAGREELARLAQGAPHQGVVAVLPGFPFRTLEDLIAPGEQSVLVLDGVQDPRNLGAILRTARAAGAGGVVLPQDRCCGITPVVAAASAGQLFGLPMARVTNVARTLETLKGAGFWTVGLVPGAPRSIFDLDRPGRVALVVGGEGEGIRPLVRRGCDFEVAIPMSPGVESLNASVATAIALYELLVRRGGPPIP